MTGGDDGYAPHPGDPWHPNWDPERASRDEEFVPEREVREPRAGRRGLFRRRPAEPEPEFPAEAPVEEAAPVELVGEEPAGSVDDVYEPLRAEAPPVAPPPPPAPVAAAETATVASDAEVQWGEFVAGVDLASAARTAPAPPQPPPALQPPPAPVAEAAPVAVQPDPAVEPAEPSAADAERAAAEEAAHAEAARLAAEEAARAEAARLAAEEAERAAAAEAARLAAEEAERAAAAEAERLAAEEAARAEAARLAAEEAERAAAAEAERLAAEEAARAEAERLAAEEAERAAAAEAERLAAEEAERAAAAEAERLAVEEAERAAAARSAAEEAARAEAERLANEEAERAEAERVAREEAERAAAAEADRLAEEAAARAGVGVVAPEPEVVEPQLAEPETAEAEWAEPVVAEPELVEPGLAEAEWAEPVVVEPELVEPGLAEPEAAEPEVAEEWVEVELAEPDLAEPELAEPDELAEPEVAEPELAAAEVTAPELVEPQVAEPVEVDTADAEAERLAEEAWRRAEAEFGAPATIDHEVELDKWRDFAAGEAAAPVAETVPEAEVGPEPAAPRRRWWRRSAEPEAVIEPEAVAETEAPPLEPMDEQEEAALVEELPAEPEPAEPAVIGEAAAEAIDDETLAVPDLLEPVAVEAEAAAAAEQTPPKRSWWRRAFGLPPAGPTQPSEELAPGEAPAEGAEPIAVFPPPLADDEAQEAAAEAEPVPGAPWWQTVVDEVEEAAPADEARQEEPELAEPVLAEAEWEEEPIAAAWEEQPVAAEAAWEDGLAPAAAASPDEEIAADEAWAAEAAEPIEPVDTPGLQPAIDPLAIEPLVDEEPPVDAEAEARRPGRVGRWWRRVFALETPEAVGDEEEAVAAEPALAAGEPAAGDLLAVEPVEDPLATAWAEEPMPVVDFPEAGEAAVEEPVADDAEVGAWLSFAEGEPAEVPEPGASWLPPEDAVPVADEALLDEVPALPHWAEPAADAVAPEPEELAEPEEAAAPEQAEPGDELVAVAAFDLSPEDDDEFRLEEISEEHYYLQATTQEHVGLAESVAAAAEQQGELQAVAAAIPGVESGVVGFDDVTEGAYQTEDEEAEEVAAAAARRGSELTLRVVTGLLLGGLFLGALWWNATALSVLVVVVVLVALGEFYAVMIRQRYQPLALFGLIGGAVALLGARIWGAISVPGALMLTATLVFFYYAMSPHRRAPLLNGAVTLTGVAWVTGFAAFLMPMLDAEDYRVLVFAVVMITVFTDIGSYFTGRSRGRHKLAPVVSPGKTIEGLIGGALVAIGIGAAIGQLDPLTTVDGIILGATIAAVAPIGDLSVSMLKRSLGIKHMSGILPGHGGLLDRVDGLLFAVPAAWLVLGWLGLLG